MTNQVKTAFIIAVALILLLLGYAIGRITFEPKVVEIKVPKVSYITVTVNKTETILVPYEVIKEVVSYITIVEKEPYEVIVYRNAKLRYFVSEQELRAWFGTIHLPLKPDSEGVIQLIGRCEDDAMALRDRAEEDGYRMSFETLTRDEYYKWYGKWIDEGRLHAINSAIIGNEHFYIDYRAKKIWVGVLLDDPK